MYTALRKSICVFYASPEKSGEISRKEKANEAIDTNAVMQFSETLLENFLQQKTRQETAKYLTGVIEKLKPLPPALAKECQKKIDIMKKWMDGKSIFDERGNTKDISKNNALKEMKISLGIKETGKKIEVKNTKEIEEFKQKYPIEKFKETVYKKCIEHPFITNTWIFFNEYKELKSKVARYGNALPPEYAAVIGTIDNIRKEPIFGNNTGKFDAARNAISGNEESMRAFQKNMQNIINLSAEEKKVFTISDFEKKYYNDRPLDKNEIQLRDLFLIETNAALSKIETKTGKITFLKDKIQKLKESNKYRQKLSEDINSFLVVKLSEAQRGANDDIKGQIGQKERDFRSSNKYADVLIEAEKKQKQTGEPHFVDYDSSKNEYVILSTKDISSKLLQKDLGGLDRTLFQSLLRIPGWDKFMMKYIGFSGIAAIGSYVNKNHGTELFKGVENAKTYFQNAYDSTVKEQNLLLKESNISQIKGSLISLFPQTIKIITNKGVAIEEIEKGLRGGNIGKIYDRLSGKITNGEMANIMENVKNEMNKIKNENIKIALEESNKWKGKSLDDVKGEFIIGEKDEKFWNKIRKQRLDIDNISLNEKEILLKKLKPDSQLKKYLESIVTANIAAKAETESAQLNQEAKKGAKDKKSEALSEAAKKRVNNASIIGQAKLNKDLHTSLIKQNNNPKDQELQAQIKTQQKEDTARLAIAVKEYVNTPGISKEDTRDFMRSITGIKASDKEIDRWIDTQVFISKYVEDKNFVDIVEKNAAYMNLLDKKEIGSLYGDRKLDIENMSSESGSISLGKTNALGETSLQGMNDLMKCRVEVGTDGVFTRTIRTPDGNIIAENIPLENIDATIKQLSRFYALGLGVLAPYMPQISQSIGKTRTDKISGLDGDFDINEDKKFLKIFAIMLFGKEALPEEMNIPSLIRVFNKSGIENNPKFKLKNLGILNDGGGINTYTLDNKIKEASLQV